MCSITSFPDANAKQYCSQGQNVKLKTENLVLKTKLGSPPAPAASTSGSLSPPYSNPSHSPLRQVTSTSSFTSFLSRPCCVLSSCSCLQSVDSNADVCTEEFVMTPDSSVNSSAGRSEENLERSLTNGATLSSLSFT